MSVQLAKYIDLETSSKLSIALRPTGCNAISAQMNRLPDQQSQATDMASIVSELRTSHLSTPSLVIHYARRSS